MHDDLAGVYQGWLDLVIACDGPATPVQAVAWMDLHDIKDKKWWWRMFSALNAARSAHINEKTND